MAPKKRVKQQSAQKNPTKKSEDPDYLKKVDPILMKNIKQLTAGRSNLRIFVPMCGKTPDMLWLAEQGHAITGVEINARYIKAFFRNAELECTLRSEQFTPKKKVNVYEAKGKDITLYQCDIFDYNVEFSGQFDAIWDQSAIPIVNDMGARRLKQYTSLMQALLKPDGRHMLEVCKHGSNFVDEKMLKSLFGDKSDVRYLGTRIWKYDPEEFAEEECDEEGEEVTGHGHHEHEHESHGHEEHGHGDHGDEEGETEMFYHLITFKDKGVPTEKRKRKNEESEKEKKSKKKKAVEEKAKPNKKARK